MKGGELRGEGSREMAASMETGESRIVNSRISRVNEQEIERRQFVGGDSVAEFRAPSEDMIPVESVFGDGVASHKTCLHWPKAQMHAKILALPVTSRY
jgi:hypothetical protein